MSLLKIIIFFGLATMLTHCGNQEGNNESTVKVAQVENGTPKAEDGRIILSSQSADNPLLFIPEGTCENCLVNSQKLGLEIANKLKSVSKVYDISLNSKLYVEEALVTVLSFGSADETNDYFSTSFTVETVLGVVHTDIKCKAWTNQVKLILDNCGNDQAVLSKRIAIAFDEIVINGRNKSRTRTSVNYNDL